MGSRLRTRRATRLHRLLYAVACTTCDVNDGEDSIAKELRGAEGRAAGKSPRKAAALLKVDHASSGQRGGASLAPMRVEELDTPA